jgi:hypothetical protein
VDRVRVAAFVRTETEPNRKDFRHSIRLIRKYSADQPRSPAGNPDGGQWTGGEESGESEEWIDTALAETSETLKIVDELVCRRLKSRPCWAQAMDRYAAC